MAELNAHSDHMVLIISCKAKNANDFTAWSKDRASKYVYDLKEENTISYEWHISDDGTEATLNKDLCKQRQHDGTDGKPRCQPNCG